MNTDLTPRQALWFCAGLGAIAGALLVFHETGALSSRSFVILSFIILIATLPLTWLYWRRIDELAREAHKSAWMWGGSIGMGLSAIPMFLLTEAVRRDWLDLRNAAPEITAVLGYAAGVGTVLFLVLTGYLVSWVIFWSRKS